MEVQLPYLAEYAKTGRASCKGCKQNIGQGSLRIAVMVQSAFHDGKQPNWHHEDCFFKKQRPKSVGDIGKFENLKFDDQKKIKEKIESASADVVEPETKGKGKKRAAGVSDALKDFGIEYAKSGRAECRGCQQKIIKGEIRIKKVVYDTEAGMKFGGQPLWHHVECFEQIRNDLGFMAAGDLLPGFKSLKKDDKGTVLNTLKAVTDAPSAKKVKPEPKDKAEIKKEKEQEEKLKQQNEEFFKWKTNLGALQKDELVNILSENGQHIPSGREETLEACSDLLTFGALGKCKKCKGNFVFANSHFICDGVLSEWAKCMTVLTEPPRKKVKIPTEYKSRYDFFKGYNKKPSVRLFMQGAPPTKSSLKNEPEDTGPRVYRERPKLYNMEFLIIGKTESSKDVLNDKITKLGGKLTTKLHANIAAVISNEDEIEKMTKRMADVKRLEIHVVPESFLDTVQWCEDFDDVICEIEDNTICNWGVDPALRISEDDNRNRKSMYTKSASSSKVTLKLGAGGAVEPESGLADVAYIYVDEDGRKYNTVLTNTDIQTGKNSFYKMQLLKANSGTSFWVYRAWGRIGTTIGGNKLESYPADHLALAIFETLYSDLTGNYFHSDFVKVAGKYAPVDIDYSRGRSLENVKSKVPSKLDKPVQDLIRLLFDVDMMRKVMLEFELDTEKMPLGKISKKQLETGYVVLNELSQLIVNGASQHEFIGASNKFYSIVPHNFGIKQPTLISTNELIKSKIEMLDSLMEIELAFNMLNETYVDDDKNPLDVHYSQLKTEMEILDHGSAEFKRLLEYVKNTHADTHKMYELEVVDVFKVKREGEEKRFKPFKKLHNRKLLWHGSRLTNFVGILSNGLKIAPPEAPCTGYMFGKGIYFADMVSKSANYCFTSSHNNTGMLMLCEVALGNMCEFMHGNYVTQLPKNKHCTKGVGKTQPNAKESVIMEDGLEVPLGRPVTDQKINSSLLYNEYIVYDVAQVQCKYLLKMNFHYKY